MMARRPIAERFWEKVDKSGDCWEWTAVTKSDGYGVFTVSAGVKALAHRYAYEILVGPIADGLTIDHLCRNRGCVNPAHLEAVTMRENTMRGDTISARNAAKTHCANGHEFTFENTLIKSGKKTQRRCRQCKRDEDARYRARKRHSPSSGGQQA